MRLNMARKFEITNPNNDWLFVDKYARTAGYIAYRHLIEHALFSLIQNNIPKDIIKENFKNLKNNFDNKVDVIDIPIPLKIYFFKSDPKKVVVIDETKFCFPLICDIGDRPFSFKSAIKNIYNSLDSILKFLEKYKNDSWNKDIQDGLDNFDDRDISKAA